MNRAEEVWQAAKLAADQGHDPDGIAPIAAYGAECRAQAIEDAHRLEERCVAAEEERNAAEARAQAEQQLREAAEARVRELEGALIAAQCRAALHPETQPKEGA